MKLERFSGLMAIAAILLVVVLVSLKPADWINTIVNVIGWMIAIGAAAAAWLKSQEQIGLAQNQLKLQQRQIDESNRDARQAKYLALAARVEVMDADLRSLHLAKSYLLTFAERFPVGNTDAGYSEALMRARNDAADIVSQSAIRAPFGFGESISTVMSRMQLIGDRMEAAIDRYGSTPAALLKFNPVVQGTIFGIRNLADQIENQLPSRRKEFELLADERDLYVEHATSM